LRYLSLKGFFVRMGVKASFVKTAGVGKVAVTYEINDGDVNVKVDFHDLQKQHPKKIFVLNEQSAQFFRKYSDAHNVSLVDKQIGAWDVVRSEWACFANLQGQVGFQLWKVNGSVLRRGRETMNNCLNWAGLDYEVSPDSETFKYKIAILRGSY